MREALDEWDDYSESDVQAPPADAPAALTLQAPADALGERLDRVLARLLPDYSRNRLQTWIEEGRVSVDGIARAGKYKLFGHETLKVTPATEIAALADAAEDIPLRVVHADADIIIVDKPAGLVVHPGSGIANGTLLNALLHHFPETAGVPRAGIVHRLDRDTSGLMVVGRTLRAQTRLVEAMKARQIGRTYTALATGRLESSQWVDAPVGRDPRHRTRMAVVPSGREARTFIEPLELLPGATLLDCTLETGRTHQIRVHCRYIGHPLVGDPVYLTRKPASPLLAAFPRQALHARRLELPHPVSGEACAWDSPLPADLRDLLEALRDDAA
ncbi:MAG: RluA family pseudouridine synthase [Rhodocyclaceae bacterium]|nr:RluA family pseudouridine synthase [Rhodocyclaceae bacterium]